MGGLTPWRESQVVTHSWELKKDLSFLLDAEESIWSRIALLTISSSIAFSGRKLLFLRSLEIPLALGKQEHFVLIGTDY